MCMCVQFAVCLFIFSKRCCFHTIWSISIFKIGNVFTSSRLSIHAEHLAPSNDRSRIQDCDTCCRSNVIHKHLFSLKTNSYSTTNCVPSLLCLFIINSVLSTWKFAYSKWWIGVRVFIFMISSLCKAFGKMPFYAVARGRSVGIFDTW